MTVSTEYLSGEDWQVFKGLRLEMLRVSPAAFGSSLDRETAYDETAWRDFLSAIHPIVLKQGDGIVGTAGYLCPLNGDPTQAKIVSMYVRPAFRGRGCGRRLLDDLVLRIRHETVAQEAVLNVFPANRRALSVYESAGFQVSFEIEDASKRGTDKGDILMRLALDR